VHPLGADVAARSVPVGAAVLAIEDETCLTLSTERVIRATIAGATRRRDVMNLQDDIEGLLSAT